MKISIAMATYNGMKYIQEQLDSIRLQNMKADELIITDDASTDGTYEYIKKYIEQYELAGWRIERNVERIGYICNFNKALSMCSGDIVFTCDQDDIWHRDKIEILSRLMDGNKEIKVAASSLEFIDADGKKITKEYIPYNMVQVRENELKKIEFLKILEKNFFPGCTMAMRKEIVNKYCSHHNKDIPHDWLILMLGAEENGLYWYNSKLISYRIHGNNTAGLAAANHSRLQYIRHTVDTWKEYCEEFDKRIEFIQKNYNFADKKISDICKVNDIRCALVLRKDTEKVRFIRRIKLFCKELTIYLKGLRGQLDGRGLLIDFIYVLKV